MFLLISCFFFICSRFIFLPHVGITLDIVSSLSHILEQFGLKFNLKPASRRLLSEDGFPTWFSAGDRKLLARGWRARIKPNVVVAKDGSGQFNTVAQAIASYPKNNQGRYIIYGGCTQLSDT